MAKKVQRQLLIVDLKKAVASFYFKDETRWQEVRFAHPTSKYFPGGGPAVEAFGPYLNKRQRFKKDGMDLKGADIRYSKFIRDFYVAIKKNYNKNGWTVL